MTLTRIEFLKNPNKWFDEYPDLVKDLKRSCYDWIKNHSQFYRDWFPAIRIEIKEDGSIKKVPDDTGALMDKQYLELSRKVLEQKWQMK